MTYVNNFLFSLITLNVIMLTQHFYYFIELFVLGSGTGGFVWGAGKFEIKLYPSLENIVTNKSRITGKFLNGCSSQKQLIN